MKYIDCHVHITPPKMLNPQSLDLYMLGKRSEAKVLKAFDHPDFFLRLLDEAEVDKAFLITNVSPDVEGIPFAVNKFLADYSSRYRERLIPFLSVHPRYTKSVRKDLEFIIDNLGASGIKIHPCHQLVYPNEYRTGKLKSLGMLYSIAQERRLPVMIHTGTSIFPKARSVYGNPIYVDDVAVDYPDLKIIMAHAGRPLWTDTAFFLVRRHKNVYMDISGIPPKRVLEYLPRLEAVSEKTMFGSDWAGPLIPGIKENIDSFLKLPISSVAKKNILRDTALKVLQR